MLLSSQTPQLYSYATLGVSIFLVLTVVYLILRNGGLLMKALGYTGMRIIQRLMGLVLMVIAVQFVINGVMSILSPFFPPSL
jgi:multiple antibiotic resistance protein